MSHIGGEAGKAGRHEPLERRRQVLIACLLAPAVIYVLAFAVYPAAKGLYYSFFNYNLLRPQRMSFVGFGNYARLWLDPSNRIAIVNTLIFMASAVTVEFVLGFAIALLLWRDGLFERISLALLLVPVTITPLATGLIFRALLTADYGPVGYWTRTLGLSSEHGFLGAPETALATIIAMDVWQWTPLVALVLLAGLKAIPANILEAAEVDGATAWQRFTTMVIPTMVPAILLALLLRMIDASMVFDTIYVTTNGGPDDATNVLMIAAVKQGLEFFNIGIAAAISAAMLVMVGALALIFYLGMARCERMVAP